jgi:hypothetical protein
MSAEQEDSQAKLVRNGVTSYADEDGIWRRPGASWQSYIECNWLHNLREGGLTLPWSKSLSIDKLPCGREASGCTVRGATSVTIADDVAAVAPMPSGGLMRLIRSAIATCFSTCC